MGVFDIFSKRQKKLRGEVPDEYTYDSIPEPLRVQIIHIWNDTSNRTACQSIVETLCREYGLFSLVPREAYDARNDRSELGNFLLAERDPEKALDAIELSFRVIDLVTRKWDYHAPERADDAIAELNARFQEHGIGYAFEGGEIIRVDSQLLHAEAVKPALILLGALDVPADALQRDQHSPGLSRRPVAH